MLFPAWLRRSPLTPSPMDPPHVPPAPTADEDLRTNPPRRSPFARRTTPGYGPAPAIGPDYKRNAQHYRDLYYRLHAEVDAPIDRVRRAVTEGGSENAVLVRTSDHGDLLGAHGGLHQKWFNLYDEATRVPFVIARIGEDATPARGVTAPDVARRPGADAARCGGRRRRRRGGRARGVVLRGARLPGRDLMPVVDGAPADEGRAVYLMTRDNVLEGDTGASAAARQIGLTVNPPVPLRIQDSRARRHPTSRGWSSASTTSTRRRRGTPVEAGAHLRRPGHLDRTGRSPSGHQRHRRRGVPDRPARRPMGALRPDGRSDRGRQPLGRPRPARAARHLRMQLKQARTDAIPERNKPWPYVSRRSPTARPSAAAQIVAQVRRRLGGKRLPSRQPLPFPKRALCTTGNANDRADPSRLHLAQ